MPAYNTQVPVALCPGFSIALVNSAATDSSITATQQFAVAPVPNQSGGTIVFDNTTNQDATAQYSATDVAANYKPLAGGIVASGTALPYNLSGGWVRFSFATAPTSGSLTASR